MSEDVFSVDDFVALNAVESGPNLWVVTRASNQTAAGTPAVAADQHQRTSSSSSSVYLSVYSIRNLISETQRHELDVPCLRHHELVGQRRYPVTGSYRFRFVVVTRVFCEALPSPLTAQCEYELMAEVALEATGKKLDSPIAVHELRCIPPNMRDAHLCKSHSTVQ